MFTELNFPTVAAVVGTACVAAMVAKVFFNEEARLRRRRRKNYGATVSRNKGPTVKLAVDAEPPAKH